MTPNDKIKQLQAQIEAEKRIMDNCRHDYGEAFYDPYTKSEAYGYRTVAQGSDIWAEPEGYLDVTVRRWTRKCTKCGHEQHTENQEPIVTGFKPKFT
jgi:hypothetical protein